MLRVSCLTKSYNTSTILNSFSLHLNPKEILFLVGPSGIGKSSALRCIANLDRYESGEITFYDKTPQQLGFCEWRRHITYVPQHRVSFKGTPMELFKRSLGLRSRRNVSKSTETQRLGEYLTICKSMGLNQDSIQSQQWVELSGGQAQRAIIALCIAIRPDVLLLDEPSSSCDQSSTLLVEQAIKDSGIAAIWVSHDPTQPHRVGGRIMNMSPPKGSPPVRLH
ncbi:Sulfate/thiosulfate import ATP-binding protein CysA [Gracilariopsis chorda]|uniref:Probable ATP-dependent transporter ycf16 n=1 Tax=Gracilariopsis chorda TaxID=448386 RepID=A0A2V3IRU0_9FLOR|nr:Sulfate/thiosulfate import ATP-binding protein CysA [Gracilariopsis chorda]|eukprot:PXF43840.1 Sulfate/thiosulfate import ATP-binding protein CysA [Gracilariopsis chorda]